MKLTAEQFEKMNAAATAEELIAFAKSEGIEATEEQIRAQFNAMHREGRIDDDELDNVAGGCSWLDGYSRPETVSVRVEDIGNGNYKYYCPICNQQLAFQELLWDSNDAGTCSYPYYLERCCNGHVFRNYYISQQWTKN